MTDSRIIPGGCDVGCQSCAFREASETRGEVYNVTKATLCELGGVPFYCHISKSGEDFHHSEVKPPIEQMRVCEGWKQAIRQRAKEPFWRKDRHIKKALAELALGALEELTKEHPDDERRRYLSIIRRTIERLTGRKMEARNASA